MRSSIILSLAALAFKSALADWDMQYTTYVVPGTIDGTTTSWSIEHTVRDQGSACNGCSDRNHNPCNCNMEFRHVPTAGNTFKIYWNGADIGWCRPEGYPNYKACHGALWSSLGQKTHRCYSANCGPHKKRDGFHHRSLEEYLAANNITDDAAVVRPVAPLEAGRTAALGPAIAEECKDVTAEEALLLVNEGKFPASALVA